MCKSDETVSDRGKVQSAIYPREAYKLVEEVLENTQPDEPEDPDQDIVWPVREPDMTY